jgi:hypothetical protein
MKRSDDITPHPCCAAGFETDQGRLGVRTDKTHCEHNGSGYPSIAVTRADIDWRRLVPGADMSMDDLGA